MGWSILFEEWYKVDRSGDKSESISKQLADQFFITYKKFQLLAVISMLIGEYNHTLDAKKRLAVPSKLRKELGEQVVITRGLDNCLFLFPMKAWEELAAKLSTFGIGQQDNRSFVRLLLSGATDVTVDQLGRVLVPDYLRNYAGLQKAVIIAGVGSRLEIWDAGRWEKYKENLESNADKIAEKLGELGIV